MPIKKKSTQPVKTAATTASLTTTLLGLSALVNLFTSTPETAAPTTPSTIPEITLGKRLLMRFGRLTVAAVVLLVVLLISVLLALLSRS